MLNRCIYVLLLLLLYIFLYISLSNRFGNCSVSNEKILRNLGLKKVKENVNRKSFVEKSRMLSNSRDSRIFVVKLPPNANYYMANKPIAVPQINNSQQQQQQQQQKPHPAMPMPGKKPPVSFATNGQPNRIYHWNLPLLQAYQKKLESKKNHKLQWKKKLLADTLGTAAAAKNLIASKTASLLAAKQSIFVPVRRNKATNFYRFENVLNGGGGGGSNGRPHSFYLINPSGQKSSYQKLIHGQYEGRGRFY